MQTSMDPVQVRDVIGLAYSSYQRVKDEIAGRLDRDVRHPEWTGKLLSHFGRPDTAAYNVMVAGSKGKGSHAILTAAMLQRAGLRTGLFTGPHHVDFMERFRVNGHVMSEASFCRLMGKVYDVAESLPIPDNQYLGPVGMLAVIAALWFGQQQTDVNIYECGRGAKHDDVNQIHHRGAILTPVFLEHQEQLGVTLNEIVTEKLGVVTSETRWLVCGKQHGSVNERLREQTECVVCQPLQDNAFTIQRMMECIEVHAVLPNGTIKVRLPLHLELLAENAVAALSAAVAVWNDLHPDDAFPSVLDLTDVRLPGRMDILSVHPLQLLDGTIHRDSAEPLARFAKEMLQSGNVSQFSVMASLPADKDGQGVLACMAPYASHLILTECTNRHLRYTSDLRQAAESLFSQIEVIEDVEAAFTEATSRLTDRDGLLMVGTQSFVGDILRLSGERTCPIWR